MISLLCKWYFDIDWHKFEKRWADVFQIYPNAIHLNPLQFCPSMPLLDFPVFCLNSSIVLNHYFHILVNSMTIWSVLKFPKTAWPRAWPKTAWPSPFKFLVCGWKATIQPLIWKLFRRAGMAQWWERSLPADVSQVRFSDPASLLLLREVFHLVLRFSSLLKN